MAVLECSGVEKAYKLGKLMVPALKGISCSFEAGEFVSLMGPSGSGKSTLLNILGLIDEPSSGEIRFDSIPLTGKDDGFLTRLRGGRIGFVFQSFNLIPILTIRENIEFPLSRSEYGGKEIRRRSEALLEETGLGGLGRRYPNEVSGGQRQRAAIARALIHDPLLILADEPTANLDTETGKAIVSLLHNMTRNKGSTVILATHDPEIVSRSDRLLRLRDGALVRRRGIGMRKLSAFLLFMSIAVRNVWRSRRRSAITMLSIAVGTITLILLSGYILIMDGGLKSSTIEKETGYFQIAKKGYFEDDALSMDHTLDDADCASIEEWLYSQSGMSSVTRRLQIAGMIGNSRKSTVFYGICDTSDALVSMVPTIIEGSTLSSSDPEGIVIGKKLADKIDAKLNDPVLVFVSTDSGAPEAVAARIRGIYKGVMAEQESMIIYMPIETAWSLMLERRSQRIIGFADRLEDLPALATKIRAYLEASRPDLELKLWDELALMYKQIIGMFSAFVAIAGAIIFLVIVFGISNTMYMAIHDRTHEIGTMRAMGKSKGYIVRLFFAEGALLGLFGAALGTALSLALIPLINAMNITFPPGPGQTDRIPLAIQGDPTIIAVVILICVACASLASILPSWKASRQRIADSLRFS